MMKSVQRALAFGLLVSLSGLAAAQVMLKDGHPGKYFVKNGDTLWDISARFLEEPWQWPEIWQINEKIRNPHPHLGLLHHSCRHRQLPGITSVSEIQLRLISFIDL